MFNTKELERLRAKVSAFEDSERTTRARHMEAVEKLKDEHKKEVETLKKDHLADTARAAANEDVRLMEATAELKNENAELKVEKNILTGKVEMFEKAFENMGFDVKDMKEILNKLVDGLVAKNAINLVTTKA